VKIDKNGLGILGIKKSLPKNICSHDVSRYKIKDNLSSLIPCLNKDFKTQWSNIVINENFNLNKPIALIPP
jgi:hypothetical protein